MRKDMRFAWAAGGLLVIVMAVYLIVAGTSGRNKNSQPVQLVTEAPANQSASPAVEPAAPTPPAHAAVAEATPAAQTATPAQSADSSATSPKTDVWGTLLTTGQAPAGMLMTQTPRASEAQAASPTPDASAASANQSSDAADTPPAAAPDATASTAAASTAIAGNAPAAADTAPANTARPTGVATKHIVQAGETFSTISAKAYGNSAYWSHIARANPNVNPRHLRVGQVLVLPDAAEVTSGAHAASPQVAQHLDPAKQYAVQAGDNLYKISVKLYGSGKYTQTLYDLNKQTIGPNPAHLKLNMVLQLPKAPDKH